MENLCARHAQLARMHPKEPSDSTIWKGTSLTRTWRQNLNVRAANSCRRLRWAGIKKQSVPKYSFLFLCLWINSSKSHFYLYLNRVEGICHDLFSTSKKICECKLDFAELLTELFTFSIVFLWSFRWVMKVEEFSALIPYILHKNAQLNILNLAIFSNDKS